MKSIFTLSDFIRFIIVILGLTYIINYKFSNETEVDQPVKLDDSTLYTF